VLEVLSLQADQAPAALGFEVTWPDWRACFAEPLWSFADSHFDLAPAARAEVEAAGAASEAGLALVPEVVPFAVGLGSFAAVVALVAFAASGCVVSAVAFLALVPMPDESHLRTWQV
jgi:hypothetical protein